MQNIVDHSIVFIRILGNDLPPRHKRGQTIENVNIILNNESRFDNCKKVWLLNRIVDSKQEKRIIKLLKAHGQQYFRIAFELKSCEGIRYNNRHKKIKKIIDLNHARNVALLEGRKKYRWVLPFDGNCFFTDEGWEEFIRAINNDRDIRYAIVPMARLSKNHDILDKSQGFEFYETWMCRDEKKGRFLTEPQIAFRFDTTDMYDEDCIYGKVSKVNMLWRLGVPGIWDQWQPELREKALQNKSVGFGMYIKAGYVIRLSSGNPKAERNPTKRHIMREVAIDILINKVERKGISRLVRNLFICFPMYKFKRVCRSLLYKAYNKLLKKNDVSKVISE